MRGGVERVHVVGSGGSGMSGLAEVLAASGYRVSGYDLRDGPTCERLRALALRAHMLLGCEGYSRTDFIVPRAPDGHTRFEEPVLLEVNTLPGLTPRSLLPKEAAAEGTDFRTLCLSILRHGLDATRAPR